MNYEYIDLCDKYNKTPLPPKKKFSRENKHS